MARVRLGLRDLEQIAKIERVVLLQPEVPQSLVDCALDGVRGAAGSETDEPPDHRPDGPVAPLRPEIENKARMGRHPRGHRSGLQLVHQPGLADPGLAANEDDGAGGSCDAGVEDRAELSHLRTPADEPANVGGRELRSARAPDLDGTSEPFQRHGAHGHISDHMGGRPVDRVGNQRLPGGGACEKPGGEIGRLSGDRVAAVALAADRACDDFAHGDADVRRKRSRRTRVQPRKGGLNLQCGAHRAFGVIAVGDRRAEQSHGRVADVLVDRSSEPVDDGVDQGEETLQQRVHVFRIQLRR